MRAPLIVFILGAFLSSCASLTANESHSQRALASVGEHKFYKGTDTNYGVDGKTINYSVQYYCDRTVDQDARKLYEHTVLVFANGKSTEFDEEMTVDPDGSTFTLVDSTKTVSGGGKFIGQVWAWSGMSATFKRSNGMRTEDTNIISDDFITGLKKDFSAPTEAFPNGQLTDYDVGILTRTTQADYDQAVMAARNKK